MMNTQNLLRLIELTLLEVDNLAAKSNVYRAEQEPILGTKKVLNLLSKEIVTNPDKINERLLRAMHDLGMSAYRDFENTPLEEALNNLTTALYNEVPEYKNLKPLRMEFGNGNPI